VPIKDIETSVRLCFNTKIKRIVCTEDKCGTIISSKPDRIRSHLNVVHKLSNWSGSAKYKAWQIKNNMTNPPPLPVQLEYTKLEGRRDRVYDPIEGVRVKPGYQCTICGYCAMASALHKHYKTAHKGIKFDAATHLRECLMQQFTAYAEKEGASMLYIAVDKDHVERERLHGKKNACTTFTAEERHAIFKQMRPPAPGAFMTDNDNFRTVDSFHQVMGWNQCRDLKLIHLMMEAAHEGELKGDSFRYLDLRAFCEKFVTTTSPVIKKLPEQTRKLITAHNEEAAEKALRAFDVVQDGTQRTYNRTFTRLVAMLLRCSCEPMKAKYANIGHLPLSIQEAAVAFGKSLERHVRKVPETGLNADTETGPSTSPQPVSETINYAPLVNLLTCCLVETDSTGTLCEDAYTIGKFVKFAAYNAPGKVNNWENDLGFLLPPSAITQFTAALLYCFRLSIVWECIENRENPNAKEAEEHFERIINRIRNDKKPILKRIAIESLCMIHSKALIASKPGVATIEYVDGKTIKVNGVRVCLDTVQNGLRFLVGKAQDKLRTLLFRRENLMNTSWILTDDISDNLRSKANGYSFVSDPRNLKIWSDSGEIPCDNPSEVLSHIITNDEQLSTQYFTRDNFGKIVFKTDMLKEYACMAEEFMHVLFTLIHCTAGLPPRVEEQTAMCLINSGPRKRSVYWYKNSLMILQQ
jgi:hypothetical protein